MHQKQPAPIVIYSNYYIFYKDNIFFILNKYSKYLEKNIINLIKF